MGFIFLEFCFYIESFTAEDYSPSYYGFHNLMVICLQSFQSYRPYKDRFLPGRGRKQAPGTCFPLQRHAFSYGFAAAPQESISPREYNRQLSEAEYPVLGRGNSAKTDYHPHHLSIWESFHDIGLSNLPEKSECRSLSPPSWESHIPEVDSQSELFRANEERYLDLVI